jgi:hypothetical protein
MFASLEAFSWLSIAVILGFDNISLAYLEEDAASIPLTLHNWYSLALMILCSCCVYPTKFFFSINAS